jgi:hypothetical protein
MSDKGFDYLPPPPDIGTIGGVDWNDWDDFLGVTEKQNAESLGYRMVPDGAFGSIPTTGPDDQFDPSVEVALWGDQAVGEDGLPLAGAKKGDKGCQGEVEARLVPLVDSSLNLDIRGESLKRAKAKAQSSNQVQTALAAWKDCMHDAGYNLNEIPLIGMAEGMDADDMKRQAVVDVGCKDSSGLTDAYITNLYEAEDAEIDAHRAEFDAEEAHYQQRLQMVRDVLAGKEK